MDSLGHFLYLHFGDDAVAQFWGRYRASELDKFRTGKVRTWQCDACPARCRPVAGDADEPAAGYGGQHADAQAQPLANGGVPPTAWRAVEWPETRCYGRHLHVLLEPLPGAPPDAQGGGQDNQVGVGHKVVVNEEDVLEFTPGVRWTVGQEVHVPVAALNLVVGAQPVAWPAVGPAWLRARLTQFQRCNRRMGPCSPLTERRVDCFVLLLSRDGSHGLDLSMVTNLFLIDKIWDPAVEQQVVARAFRVGAQSAVDVEQLIMAGTVEEDLHGMAAPSADAGASSNAVSASRAPRPVAMALTATPEPGASACAEHEGPAAGDDGGAGVAARKRPAHGPRAVAAKRPAADLPAPGEDMSAAIVEHARDAEGPRPPCPARSPVSSGDRRRDEARLHALLRGLRFLRAPVRGSRPRAQGQGSSAGEGAGEGEGDLVVRVVEERQTALPRPPQTPGTGAA